MMTEHRGKLARVGSIRVLLFLLFLIILAPILLVHAGIYYREFLLARREEYQANLEVARAVARLFELYVKDVHREEMAAGQALMLLSPGSSERASNFLTRMDAQYPAVVSLSWTDAHGRVVASSVRTLIGLDWSNADWLQQAAVQRGPVVTDSIRSQNPQQSTFTIASAIEDAEGVFRGVVAAEIDPVRLTDWIKIDRAGEGSVSLVDSSGWLVYRYPKADIAWQHRDRGKLYPPVRRALQGRESWGEVLAAHENRKRFVSATPISSIGWAAAAGAPAEEVIGPVIKHIRDDAVAVTVTALFALLAAALIARRIAAPIGHLSELALELGRGDLHRRVKESGPEEMLNLARALNRMAGELQLREHERERLLQVERERGENARLLEAIQENAQTYLAYLDLDLHHVLVNNAYCEQAGCSREQLIGRPYEEVVSGPEVTAALRRVRDTGEVARLPELARESKQHRGMTRHWDWAAAPVRDEQGSVYGIVVSAVEVTDQVLAREERLAVERTRAEMAETVATEINHRMKNNLILLSSMLQMQLATQPPESQAAAQLRDAIMRISSLSVVHEQIHAGQPGKVDLKDILQRISEIATTALARSEVELRVTGDSIYAPSRVGTMVATIANELVTNAIKYGAPGADGKLKIQIDLSEDSGKLRLFIWGSGNPIPPDFDLDSQQGMGLRLVRDVVVGQLQGTFVLCPYNNGTVAEAVTSIEFIK